MLPETRRLRRLDRSSLIITIIVIIIIIIDPSFIGVFACLCTCFFVDKNQSIYHEDNFAGEFLAVQVFFSPTQCVPDSGVSSYRRMNTSAEKMLKLIFRALWILKEALGLKRKEIYHKKIYHKWA